MKFCKKNASFCDISYLCLHEYCLSRFRFFFSKSNFSKNFFQGYIPSESQTVRIHFVGPNLGPTVLGLENSIRPLVFTSASGCRASENFDISSEN